MESSRSVGHMGGASAGIQSSSVKKFSSTAGGGYASAKTTSGTVKTGHRRRLSATVGSSVHAKVLHLAAAAVVVVVVVVVGSAAVKPGSLGTLVGGVA